MSISALYLTLSSHSKAIMLIFSPNSALKLVFVDIFAKAKAVTDRYLLTDHNKFDHDHGGRDG